MYVYLFVCVRKSRNLLNAYVTAIELNEKKYTGKNFKLVDKSTKNNSSLRAR